MLSSKIIALNYIFILKKSLTCFESYKFKTILEIYRTFLSPQETKLTGQRGCPSFDKLALSIRNKDNAVHKRVGDFAPLRLVRACGIFIRDMCWNPMLERSQRVPGASFCLQMGGEASQTASPAASFASPPCTPEGKCMTERREAGVPVFLAGTWTSYWFTKEEGGRKGKGKERNSFLLPARLFMVIKDEKHLQPLFMNLSQSFLDSCTTE